MDNFPRVIPVIQSKANRGSGKQPSDPVRNVMQYHTLDGVLLAEFDEWAEQHTINTAGLGED
jgi:hypothetical protein